MYAHTICFCIFALLNVFNNFWTDLPTYLNSNIFLSVFYIHVIYMYITCSTGKFTKFSLPVDGIFPTCNYSVNTRLHVYDSI